MAELIKKTRLGKAGKYKQGNFIAHNKENYWKNRIQIL